MLTDQKIKALKPKGKQYKISDEKGMFLLVMPNGGKYWRLKYRFADKEKNLAIGVYPTVTLKQARLDRDEAKKLIQSGIDPMQNKKEKANKTPYSSFKQIALSWMDNQKAWADNTRSDALSRFNNHIFPFIGDTTISEIERQSLISIIDRLKTKQIHSSTITKIHRLIVNTYKQAIALNACERNLAIDIQPLLPKGDKTEHRKALSTNEIPLFLNKLENYEGSFETICALKLLILTAARPNEIYKATWCDFDLDKSVWIIPSTKMKKRKEHPIPLSKQAQQILKKLQTITGNREYLFPNQRNPKLHMSENTLNQAIKKRMGFDATAHGMRSVFSTLMNEEDFNPDAIDVHLSHTKDSTVRRAYNRSPYWNERLIITQKWADYLDNLK